MLGSMADKRKAVGYRLDIMVKATATAHDGVVLTIPLYCGHGWDVAVLVDAAQVRMNGEP